jgi:hypothetical protein
LTVQGTEQNLPSSDDVVAFIAGARVISVQIQLATFAQFDVVKAEFIFVPLFLAAEIASMVLILSMSAHRKY